MSQERFPGGGEEVADEDSLDLVPGIASIFCFFVINFNYFVYESLATIICIEQLGWTEEASLQRLGLLLFVMAVIAVLSLIHI